LGKVRSYNPPRLSPRGQSGFFVFGGTMIDKRMIDADELIRAVYDDNDKRTLITIIDSLAQPVDTEAVVVSGIIAELRKAEAKHPNWPKDIIHQIAIMAEESGEAVRAALHVVYENKDESELRKELEQTAAMCIRAIIELIGRK
jgi:predicted lipid-binding transport protein (Tim44 family)